MKKKLLYLLVTIVILVVLAYTAFWLMSESKPKIMGNGDELAKTMLQEINVEAWDSLTFLQWSFNGRHEYVWDKKNNLVVVKWDDHQVNLTLDKLEGNVYTDGKLKTGFFAQRLVKKAWKIWCNDSYWMFAPFKVFDEGTTRSVAKSVDGKEGLLVEYKSGGVTPGDAYFWLLDENNRPKAFKMWVSIIPIKGVEASWDEWIVLPGGSILATKHKLPFFISEMKKVKEGKNWQDFGFETEPTFK